MTMDTVMGTAQAAPSVQQEQEKLLPQSEVNEIVKRAKNQAVEQYKKLYSEQPEYAQQKYGDSAPAFAARQPTFDETHYRKIAAEEAQRMRDDIFNQAQKRQQEEYAQNLVQKFVQKIEPAKSLYEDFEKVTGDLNLQPYPHVVQILAENIDNAGDLLYELSKDRLKLNQLEGLAERSRSDAIVHAQRLAQAMKERREATKTQTTNPREPLTKMLPQVNGSTNNTMDWKELTSRWTV